MKTNFRLLLALLIFVSSSVQAQEPVDVTIIINGTAIDKEPPARLVNGRVLIPLRKVFNALGADVVYENKIITATRGERVVILSPNVNQASIDGQDVLLDVPPLLFDAATYVPLRLVAQALGDVVVYDAPTKTITVQAPLDPIEVPPDRLTILAERLKRLLVGNQGAILKVWNTDQTQEVYYRGLDDRATAPYDQEDQVAILNAIELSVGMDRWVADTIEGFRVLPKRQAVAFLGLVNSIEDSSPLDPGPQTDQLVENFLIEVVAEDPDVVLRRQAVLSMAVGGEYDPEELESVLKLYESSENLWETFPVQQYFQYHAEELRRLPNLAYIRARVAAVNSLYTANILGYLDGRED